MPITLFDLNISRTLPNMPADSGASISVGGASTLVAESLSNPGVFNAGDFYSIPINTHPTKLIFRRTDETKSAVWTANINNEWLALSGETVAGYLGFTMDLNNNIVVVVHNDGAVNMTLGFLTINDITGAVTALDVSTAGAQTTWPVGANSDDIRLLGASFDFNTAGAANDLTRTFIDINSDGNFIVSAQSANPNNPNPMDVVTNALIVIDSVTGAIISQEVMTLGDGSTLLERVYPQYVSRDGKIKLGQIFSLYDRFTGEFKQRYSTISRGNNRRLINIPNNAQQFFTINRNGENGSSIANVWAPPRGATLNGSITDKINSAAIAGFTTDMNMNPWFNNGADDINVTYSSDINGINLWPEPIKVITLNNNVALSPVPMHNNDSSIARSLISGAQFMTRTAFDNWLVESCNILAMGE